MVNRNTILEDISAEIGYTATTTLVGWYGGRELRIPLHFRPDHQIVKLIGPSATKRLISAFGGEYLFVPKDSAQKTTRTNRIVFDMLTRGSSVSKVSSRLSFSPFGVIRIRRKLEAAGLLPMIFTEVKAPNDVD
jgi:hypothetical protein